MRPAAPAARRIAPISMRSASSGAYMQYMHFDPPRTRSLPSKVSAAQLEYQLLKSSAAVRISESLLLRALGRLGPVPRGALLSCAIKCVRFSG